MRPRLSRDDKLQLPTNPFANAVAVAVAVAVAAGGLQK